MAVKIVEETKTLSEFPEITKTCNLDHAMQEVLLKVKREIRDNKKKIRVYYPGKCDLEISDKEISIYVSERNSIDMERLLKEITLLLQKKHGGPQQCSHMAVNIRYGKHSVQFRSGHLERNDKDEMLPMREVLTYQDKTMVRTLKTLRDTDVAWNLSDELDPYSLQKSDVAVGFLKEAKESLLEGGSRKEAAKKFGFKYMAKKSEGVVPNGTEGQVCIAERLCVYSEELKEEAVVDKIIETYRLVQKVRNNPPVTMGLKSDIEIHADRKVITLVRQNSDSKTYSEFLAKLLEIAGVTDVNTLIFGYEKKISVEDTPFRKWLTAQEIHVIKFSQWLGRNDHNIAFGFLMMSLPLFFMFLMMKEYTVFQATMIMAPAVSVLICALYFSSKDGMIRRIGQGSVVLFFCTFLVIAELIAFMSFDKYLTIIEYITVIIVVVVAWIFADMKTEEKRKKMVIRFKKWLKSEASKIETKINDLREKALSNNIFVSILTVLLIIVGVVLTIMIGIAMVPILIIVAIFIPIVIFLDRRFWREIEEDRRRALDQFFREFREKRENLPEACEVRFEITKCKKLRNPFRGIPAKFAKYARSKYPKRLTLSGLKATVTKLLTAKWAEKTLHSEVVENSK